MFLRVQGGSEAGLASIWADLAPGGPQEGQKRPQKGQKTVPTLYLFDSKTRFLGVPDPSQNDKKRSKSHFRGSGGGGQTSQRGVEGGVLEPGGARGPKPIWGPPPYGFRPKRVKK